MRANFSKPLIFALFLFVPFVSHGQLSISNGINNVEFSGYLLGGIKQNMFKPGLTDLSKNRVFIDDARFEIEGRIKHSYEYDLEVNLADLPLLGSTPDVTAIINANATYTGFKFFDINVGYGKTPYSRSAMMPIVYSPFLNRADMLSSSLFWMRDFGMTINKLFWHQRIHAFGGVYTGLGPLVWQGVGDPSGQPEYIGRVDFSFPARYRYREIDYYTSPIPMVSFGMAGRYANKTLPAGTTLILGSDGAFGDNLINGKKKMICLDGSFQFQGFSAQVEWHRMRADLADSTSPLLNAVPMQVASGYFLAGGYYAQASYFAKPLKSALACRFDVFNANDLSPGVGQKLTTSYCYFLNGFNSLIRVQWTHNQQEQVLDTHKWQEQFLVGYQLLFR